MDRPIRHRQYSDTEFELYRPHVQREGLQPISAVSEQVLSRPIRHPRSLNGQCSQGAGFATGWVYVEGLGAKPNAFLC
jgi:hypothetical protein